MTPLIELHCSPLPKGTPALTAEQYSQHLNDLPNWTIINSGKAIERNFVFKNFAEALVFVNKVGALAEEEEHHPDILMHGWKNVRISLYTHTVGGLSLNDFILAAKLDQLCK